MDTLSWFDRIPMLALFVLTIVLVLLCIYAGMSLSAMMRRRGDGAESIGSVVGSTLALLAFLLAFTFNMTANRFDDRKQLLINEVNAIGTAYLRAGLLPKPYATEVRGLLREYADVRARVALEPDTLKQVIIRSEEIHDELWTLVEKMVAHKPISITQSIFIQSLNEVIDLHAKRVTIGLLYRIPGAIWFGLYAISVLAMMVVGYQSGQAKRRQYFINIVLALAFSSVILLIADLDRASEGVVTINHQPLFDLQQKLSISS